MTLLTHSATTCYAVIERSDNAGDGRPPSYGPIHAARPGMATSECGRALSELRELPAVPFASIADTAVTLVCGGCRRAILRTQPEQDLQG